METIPAGKSSRNVYLLMASQACFLASSMSIVTFSGLAGKLLSGNPAYATLATSLAIISTALSTGPMSILMQHTSRRFGFRLGALFGISGGLMGAFSLYSESFILLCTATLLLGPFQASAQYYRFAAAESVPAREAPKALSMVLVGGIFAALVVPTLTGWLNNAFSAHPFMGAFLFIAIVTALVLLPLSFLKPLAKPVKPAQTQTSEEGKAPADARPLREIIATPRFLVAVLNGGLAYAMMSFVMTATPLAVEICGYDSTAGAYIIQGHVIAMFLPSLFTGTLISRFGVLPVLLAGHALFASAFLTALSGIAIWQFSVSLIALGVGWNFCFVGASSLITQVHRESEKGKVQGLNEFIVFGMAGTASFAAGVILQNFGWTMVNQAAFVMLLVASGATMLWGISGAHRNAAG